MHINKVLPISLSAYKHTKISVNGRMRCFSDKYDDPVTCVHKLGTKKSLINPNYTLGSLHYN